MTDKDVHTLREIHHLTGQLLIAMPSMKDQNFEHTVIYICIHSMEGAMGLVINRAYDALCFKDLLKQLRIKTTEDVAHIRVHYGGPIESGRGFVLHSTDFLRQGTLKMQDQVALTVTNDILKAMAEGCGPKKSLLALGYACWGAWTTRCRDSIEWMVIYLSGS